MLILYVDISKNHIYLPVVTAILQETRLKGKYVTFVELSTSLSISYTLAKEIKPDMFLFTCGDDVEKKKI